MGNRKKLASVSLDNNKFCKLFGSVKLKLYIAPEINSLDVLVSLKIFKIWRSLLERSRVVVFETFSVLYKKWKVVNQEEHTNNLLKS